MRSTISILAAMIVAVAALTSTFVLWRTLEARDLTIEEALVNARRREADLAKNAKDLSEANARLAEVLTRLLAAEGKNKPAGDLADRVTSIENTLASSAVMNTEKLARDLNALRRDTQEAFNQVGIALAELKQQAPKPPAAK